MCWVHSSLSCCLPKIPTPETLNFIANSLRKKWKHEDQYQDLLIFAKASITCKKYTFYYCNSHLWHTQNTKELMYNYFGIPVWSCWWDWIITRQKFYILYLINISKPCFIFHCSFDLLPVCIPVSKIFHVCCLTPSCNNDKKKWKKKKNKDIKYWHK